MSVFDNDLAWIYRICLVQVIDNDILKILRDFVRIWQRPFQKISQNMSGSGNDILGECQGACDTSQIFHITFKLCCNKVTTWLTGLRPMFHAIFWSCLD